MGGDSEEQEIDRALSEWVVSLEEKWASEKSWYETLDVLREDFVEFAVDIAAKNLRPLFSSSPLLFEEPRRSYVFSRAEETFFEIYPLPPSSLEEKVTVH